VTKGHVIHPTMCRARIGKSAHGHEKKTPHTEKVVQLQRGIWKGGGPGQEGVGEICSTGLANQAPYLHSGKGRGKKLRVRGKKIQRNDGGARKKTDSGATFEDIRGGPCSGRRNKKKERENHKEGCRVNRRGRYNYAGLS